MQRAASVVRDCVRHTKRVLHNGDTARVQHCVAILDGEMLTQKTFESAGLPSDARAASGGLRSDENQLADGGEEVRRI
jgi:hypothetical protein